MTLKDVQEALRAKADGEGIITAEINTNMDERDWDDALDFATEVVEGWMQANNVQADDQVLVHYTNATWQRLGGVAPTSADKLPMVFRVDGEYTLKVQHNVPMNVLLITRYSHDEPTGALHVIKKID